MNNDNLIVNAIAWLFEEAYGFVTPSEVETLLMLLNGTTADQVHAMIDDAKASGMVESPDFDELTFTDEGWDYVRENDAQDQLDEAVKEIVLRERYVKVFENEDWTVDHVHDEAGEKITIAFRDGYDRDVVLTSVFTTDRATVKDVVEFYYKASQKYHGGD